MKMYAKLFGNRLPILMAVALSSCLSASAAKYVRAGATGAGNGNNWTDAYSSLPSSLVRGEVYYIADGNYSGYTCDDIESGSSVITIQKATLTNHGTETGWQSAYGDGQAVFGTISIMTDNWTFDGKVGGGPGSWTSGYGFRVNGHIYINPTYNSVYAWDAGHGDNVTLTHIEIDGASTSGTTAAVASDFASGLHLSYVYTYNTAECPVRFLNATDFVWEYCFHGQFCLDCDPQLHGEILSGKYSGKYTIRWNVFRWAASTGGIMIANNAGSSVEVYGNVFYRASGETWNYGGDGIVGGWISRPDLGVYNMLVYNNTFINIPKTALSPLGSTPGNNRQVRNNYFYSSDTGLPSGSWTADYNHYQDSGGGGEAHGTQGSGNPFVTLDSSSADFAKLKSDTAAGDTGVPAQYRKDWWGNTGSTRGAVQFGGGGQADLTVDAGPDQVATLPNSANLQGSYVNLLGGLVSLNWSKVSGPGTVAFASPTAATTTATFSTAGTYGLRLTATVLLVSISDDVTVTVQNPPDSAAPTVALTGPSAGTAVSGSTTLSATASDNVGIAGVRFFVSGAQVFDDTTSPYAYSWDSTWVPNGSHQIYAQARDSAGNVAWSATNTITVNNAPAVLPGAAASWSFSEGSGATAVDSVAANTLTLRNGATWTTGKIGTGLLLDGVNDRADALNSPALDIGGNSLSVAAWVKLENLGSWQQIVSKVKETGAFTPPYFEWHLFAGHASSTQWTPQFQLANTGENSVNISSSISVNYGEWVHLVGVYDGSNVRIYVNGVERGSAAQSGNIVSYNQPLYLGAHGLPGEFAKGVIDEVRVFGGALTPAQVQALYISDGTPPNSPASPSNLRIVQAF